MRTEPAGAETSRAVAPKRQTNRVTSERIIHPPREPRFANPSNGWSYPNYYSFIRVGGFRGRQASQTCSGHPRLSKNNRTYGAGRGESNPQDPKVGGF